MGRRQLPDFYDLDDALKAAADPTLDMLVLKVKEDGRIVLELPRACHARCDRHDADPDRRRDHAETFGQALDAQEVIKASDNKWEAP